MNQSYQNMKTIMRCVCVAGAMWLNLMASETFTPYQPGDVPQNPTELWQDYDARSEALEVKLIKEWKNDGVVTRYITYKVAH